MACHGQGTVGTYYFIISVRIIAALKELPTNSSAAISMNTSTTCPVAEGDLSNLDERMSHFYLADVNQLPTTMGQIVGDMQTYVDAEDSDTLAPYVEFGESDSEVSGSEGYDSEEFSDSEWEVMNWMRDSKTFPLTHVISSLSINPQTAHAHQISNALKWPNCAKPEFFENSGFFKGSEFTYFKRSDTKVFGAYSELVVGSWIRLELWSACGMVDLEVEIVTWVPKSSDREQCDAEDPEYASVSFSKVSPL
ncbi:hypothetical protein EV426DRAFT_577624 [Tirmania nivea]|nr:hypothetical protein EV426DRAFT_577624 [Tirmania nivea]